MTATVTLTDLAVCPRRESGECKKNCYMVTARTALLAALDACSCFDPEELPAGLLDGHRWSPADGDAEIARWQDVLQRRR